MKKLLRVPHEGLRPGLLNLSEEAHRYATRVHRIKTGDSLLLFDVLAQLEADAELLDDAKGTVQVAHCRASPTHTLPVELWQAVGKGDKPEQVVRDATVLGAARVVLVHTDRSVARSEAPGRGERLLRVAVEAARQCGRGGVPELRGPLELRELLHEKLDGAALGLLCSASPLARPLLAVLAAHVAERTRVVALIGPEGGISPDEEERASQAGFIPVSLGPLVLRTETAATVLLGGLRLAASFRTPG